MWFRNKHIATIQMQGISEQEQAIAEMRQELEEERRRYRELAHRIIELNEEIAQKATPPELANYHFSIITEILPVPYSKPLPRYYIRCHPVIKHPDTQAIIPGEHLKAALDIFPIDNWKWVDDNVALVLPAPFQVEMLFSTERLPTWPEVNDKLFQLREHLTKIISNAAHVSKLVQILSPDAKD